MCGNSTSLIRRRPLAFNSKTWKFLSRFRIEFKIQILRLNCNSRPWKFSCEKSNFTAFVRRPLVQRGRRREVCETSRRHPQRSTKRPREVRTSRRPSGALAVYPEKSLEPPGKPPADLLHTFRQTFRDPATSKRSPKDLGTSKHR